MPLDDYGALLRSGAASVPDYAADEARKQLRAAQIIQAKVQLAAQQREINEDDAFQSDLTSVLAHPSATNISGLMLKHPKKAQEIKGAWGVMDKARQDADLQHMSEIYSAAANKKYDLASSLMERRIAADKEAGQPEDPHDQAILDALKSGDPVQQKGALGMMGVQLAAITGPEKFESTLGALTKGKDGYTLTPGAKRFDSENNLVAEAPAAPQYREVHEIDANGNDVTKIVAIGGGGDPASVAGGGTVSPAAASVASTLASSGLPAPVVAGFMGNFHAEGGYEGAQGDGGSASGIAQWRGERAANFQRVIGKPATEATPAEQAKFVAWEMQNPEAAGMTVKQRDAILAAKSPAQAAALIDQFYERSNGRDRNVRMSAANAFAGIQGTQSGGSPQVVYSATGGKRGDQFVVLTPEQAQAENLDPAIKWQKNLRTSQITALGGQARQAKQIPQQVQTKVQPMVDVRDTINRLSANFKDDFGGHYMLGDNLNSLQGTFGVGPAGMRDWWADFKSMDNVVRNQLFGSALTEHEKRAYEATTISPKMEPAEIKKNLARRRAIVTAATTRQQNFLKKNGYDADAVDALFSPLGDFGGPSGIKQVRSLQEARSLPSGTVFKTPDGRTLRKK